MYILRRPRVAAAQVVLLALGLWAVCHSSPPICWSRCWHSTGYPITWLETSQGIEWQSRTTVGPRQFDRVNGFVPLAYALVAVFLPLGVVGLMRPEPDGRPTRIAWALAGTGLGGLLTTALSQSEYGRQSLPDLNHRRPDLLMTCLGLWLGAVIGWLMGNPPPLQPEARREAGGFPDE